MNILIIVTFLRKILPMIFPNCIKYYILLLIQFHISIFCHLLCVCVCVCVCCRSPSREVCPNYEVVEFQPRTVTPPEPMIFCLLLRIFYLSLPALSACRLMSFQGFHSPPALVPLPLTSVVSPHSIIRPPGGHLSPSQHTYAPCLPPGPTTYL